MKNKKYLITILFILSFYIGNSQTQVLINAANNGNTYTGCNFVIYDSGGPNGDYSNNENFSITICGEDGASVILDINFFNTENNFDFLYIYDGPNTGSPQMVQASGTSIQGQTFVSSGNCITIRFTSDGSVTRPGFEIFASCDIECQDFTIGIINTNPPITDSDSLWIDICPGEEITFTAQGDYPNNNTDYNQSDDNVNWVWTAISGSNIINHEGVGENTFTHVYEESGGYFVSLVAYDTNGCTSVLLEQYRVRVSLPPNFTVSADEEIVCPYEPVNFTGSVTTNTWVMSITETQVVDECIDDFVGVVQEFCWDVAAFEPGQTITSGDQFEGVCMGLEHSYLGDLEMYVQCPNGQQVQLISYPNGCGSTYLGIPGNPNGPYNCTPGTCWEYCWNMSGTQTAQNACGGFGTTLPAGTYQPLNSFDNFIGCPINGQWCIVIIDNLSLDDGTVCTVDLQFGASIIPASMWSISHEYDPSGITWSGDGMDANSGGEATAYPETPGDQTLTFSVTDDFGCVYDTTLTVHVLPYEHESCCVIPEPYAGEDDHVCTDTYTFSAELEDGNTGVWTLFDGPGNASFQNPNSPNASVNVDEWGEYTFIWTEQNMGPACSASDTVIIEFYPIPTTTFTYTPILCYGDETTITYVGNVGPDAEYNWDFSGGNAVGSGQGPYQVSWTESGPQPVRLTVSANGCTSEDTTVNILNPPELVYDLIIQHDPCYQSCEGYAEIIVNGGTGAYTYSWESGNYIYANLCTGAYSIEVTDENGCTVGQDFFINEPLEILINDTLVENVLCNGNNEGSIHISAVGGTGELIYEWNDIGVGPATRDSLFAGIYMVTIRDENDCTVDLSFVITQPEELQAVISSDVAVCEGTSVNIQMQAFGGVTPYTYFWDSGDGYEIGGNSIIRVPLVTTTYNSYVVDANGCVSDTLSMVATVSPELIIDSIKITNNRCYNSCDGRAELVLQGGIQPLQYSWGSQNHIYDGLCAGPYSVTVTDLIGCTVMSNFVISEPSELIFSADIKPATCYGYNDGSATIFVQGGTQPYSYLWPNGTTDSIMVNNAGTYTVTVTDANSCRIITSFTIEQPTEIITTPVSDRHICFGQSTTISSQATGGTPYYDFKWTGSDGSVYPVNSATVSPEQNTTYTLVVTDSLGCTSTPRVVNVFIKPPLSILSVVTSYDTICQGEPAIIQVDAVGGNGGPYFMTLQNGRVVSSPFSVSPSETTTYYITLYDNCGTPPVVDSITINVRPKPGNIFIADRVEGCVPFTVNFQETSPNVGQTYLWNFGDGGFSQSKSPSYTYTKPGRYDITLEVRDHFGCKHKRTREELIRVNRNPVANFVADPEVVSMVSSEIYFINKSLYADYYFWFFGDGDSSNFVSPRHVFRDIGEYEVMLVAETNKNCRDTAYRTVFVGNEFTFYAPTSFTPNGDGINDCFRICGNGIDKNSFILNVYDRWGNRVFETTRFNPDVSCDACGLGSWDGTNNGNRLKGDPVLSNGRYTWFCEFRDWNGTVYQRSGSVYLLR